MATPKVGDAVHLLTPEIPRLNNTRAEVVELAEWGAHVEAPAAHTGRFRAHWSEMAPYDPPPQGPPLRLSPGAAKILMGATGNPCKNCGSVNVTRNGNCEKCNDCGETSGCS